MQGDIFLFDIGPPDVERRAAVLAIQQQRCVGDGRQAVAARQRLERVVGAAFACAAGIDHPDAVPGRPGRKWRPDRAKRLVQFSDGRGNRLA